MRISVKGRYALAAVVDIARSFGRGENAAIIHIAETLGVSKIYMEQVFSQLKKSDILVSAKGPRGGYQLSRAPGSITAWEVLSALEAALVEPAEDTVRENAPDIEIAMQTLVFEPLDATVRQFLSGITVEDLLNHAEKQKAMQSFMPNM